MRIVRHLTFIGSALLCVTCTAGAQDSGATASVPGGNYSLSAAMQGGQHVAWRLETTTGKVSVCSTKARQEIVCSPWSNPAAQGAGPFAINAEFSQLSGTAWAWLIDTGSGKTFLCQTTLRSLETDKPACKSHGAE